MIALTCSKYGREIGESVAVCPHCGLALSTGNRSGRIAILMGTGKHSHRRGVRDSHLRGYY
jgi:hypothetical protein